STPRRLPRRASPSPSSGERRQMMIKRFVLSAAALLTAFTFAASAAADPAHHPLYMPDARNMQNPALQPPPICCSPVGPPVAGEPAPVNMAYFGGHVQVTPKIYLVFWGWGQPGAFDHTTQLLAGDIGGAQAAWPARWEAAEHATGWTTWLIAG